MPRTLKAAFATRVSPALTLTTRLTRLTRLTWLACLMLAVVSALPILAQPPEKPAADIDTVVGLLELIVDADPDAARDCLRLLADKVQSRELADDKLRALRERLAGLLKGISDQRAKSPLRDDAALLAATLGQASGKERARELVRAADAPADRRVRAVAALVFASDEQLLTLAAAELRDARKNSAEFRGELLGQLGRCEDARVATVVLDAYAQFEPELQPRAVELLTQRPSWSRALLAAMERGQLPRTALNANQVQRLLAIRDEQLVALVRATWGSVRTERNPQREQVIAQVRANLAKQPGNPVQGQQVFHKVCGQCHKIYGEGQDVGPDITSNGRASFEQILSNVLDPSLVIGASYQARIVVTSDGRVLTGLLTEDSPQRVILKMQGGKLETISRDDIEELRVSPLSMMPEGLETQLKPQELIDLFAFLTLDKPPSDPAARRIR